MKDIEKEFRLQVWHGIHTGKIYLTQGRYLIHLMKELDLPEEKKNFMLKTLTELIKNNLTSTHKRYIIVTESEKHDMKIKFPIACDRDYETMLAIIAPDLFYIEYACPEAKELYHSLTEEDIKEIKEYVEQ